MFNSVFLFFIFHRKERIPNSSNNEKLYDEKPGPSQLLDGQTNTQTPTSSQRKNTSVNKNNMPKWFKPM